MIQAFAYRSPKTLAQAVAVLSDRWGQVELLAGGTDLVCLLKEGLAKPQTVVNLKEIAELRGIQVSDAAIEIGPTTTLTELAEHSAVLRHLPALAEATAAIGGGPQIRNMGTLGGNLCQRNRDWYFRNGLDDVVKEETQYAAIFPRDGASYVSASTLAPPLIAYGAAVKITGPKGERTVRLENFYSVDPKTERENVLAANEIITRVIVPVPAGAKSADYQVRERPSHDWPLVQASVVVSVQGGTVASASIVLGHVAPVPVRAKAAEEAVVGKALSAETASAAGKAATLGAKPLGMNEYKVTLTQVAVKRALLAAVGNEYWRS